LNQVPFEETITAAARLPYAGGEELLANIAMYQANLGDFRSALRTANIIEANASGLDRYAMVNSVLENLALRQAKNGNVQEARNTAREIHEKHSYVFVTIAAIQAENGDLTGALKSIPHLDRDDRDTILDGNIRHELRQGNIAAALRALDALHDKDFSLWDIMYAQAKSGDLDGAFKTGNRIHDRTTHEQVLDGIVNARIEVGDFAGAEELAKGLSLEYRVRALYDIAEKQAKAGKRENAEANLNKAAELEWKDTSIFRGYTLGTIAEHEIRLGLPVHAMKQIDALPEGYDKRDALIEAGKAKLATGNAAEAEILFDRAPYPPLVAVAKATLGDTQGAVNSLRQSDSSVNIEAYMVDLVECRAKNGDVAGAFKVLSQIDGELKNYTISEAQRKLARARVTNGDFDEALRWAGDQSDTRLKAWSLMGVLEGSLEKCEPGSTKIGF